MMKKRHGVFALVCVIGMIHWTFGQQVATQRDSLKTDERVREYRSPTRVIWHAGSVTDCYVGFRHSLCHGWASGPTAWLTEQVQGIKVVAPGSREIAVNPHLGDLEYAEGTFPTPYGVLFVKHTKQPDGRIHSEIKAPKEVKIIRN